MTTWEYLIVSTATPESIALLNEHGKQGWEAVGLAGAGHGEGALLLKRPLPQARASGGRM